MISLRGLTERSVHFAELAGQFITQVHASCNLDVVDKGLATNQKFDPQTRADRGAEALIVQGLRRAFPDLVIVGEEGGLAAGACAAASEGSGVEPCGVDLSQDWPEDRLVETARVSVWVDPLDATREFTAGQVQCVSCLVGICVDEEAFAGVLVQPFSGAAWWGAVGVGARRRGARDGEWCVVDFARHHVAEQGLRSVVVSSSRPDGPVSQCVARMQAALPGLSVSQAGGCGHKLLIVAEGGADLYVFPCGGTSLWDVAAGDALFRAAGGLVLDRLGNQIRYRASAASWDNTLGIVAGRDPQAVRWCVEGFASKI